MEEIIKYAIVGEDGHFIWSVLLNLDTHNIETPVVFDTIKEAYIFIDELNFIAYPKKLQGVDLWFGPPCDTMERIYFCTCKKYANPNPSEAPCIRAKGCNEDD